MIGGFVATACTVGLLAVGALPSETGPSLVIAASITVLLSGLSVMGAVQDAIAGHVVTAAGRAAEIALLSAGLLTGVILGLKTGIWFGLFLDPAEPVAADVTRFGISTFAAAVAAAMFALACYAPLRSLAAAALAGAIGWVAYGALTLYADLGPVVATGLAAVARRPRERTHPPPHGRAPASDRPVRDHPAAARTHRVPRLLPVGRVAAAVHRPTVWSPSSSRWPSPSPSPQV